MIRIGVFEPIILFTYIWAPILRIVTDLNSHGFSCTVDSSRGLQVALEASGSRPNGAAALVCLNSA